MAKNTPEEVKRLNANRGDQVPIWHKWGPYVSERSWGTVREDYSQDGNAWKYFPHDIARSKAYRWGEDGIAGICDRYQVVALSFAFWNHKDPILKERLFGLTSQEGNHGEDVKEYYFYLDNTPTHSYMRYLYKYPQNPFPYDRLIKENASRNSNDPEFEVCETGVFNDGKYFDITIEYAKIDPDDLVIKVAIENHSEDAAVIDLLPQIVFRNVWSYGIGTHEYKMSADESDPDCKCIVLDDTEAESVQFITFDYSLGKHYFYGPDGGESLFTENETNREKLYGKKSPTHFVKDAFHRYIINQEKCVNEKKEGTKAALHYANIDIEGKGKKEFFFRFSNQPQDRPLEEAQMWIDRRKKEADAYYDYIAKEHHTEEEKRIFREALSSLLWSKQIYLFDVQRWLMGDDPMNPPPPGRKLLRNVHWRHLVSKRVMLMPDKWEYPWFAAWDLAFHCLSCALVDLDFAKEQLWLLLFDQFQHPNGQIPAYEWEFSDLNPPVQAWSAWNLYQMEYEKTGKKDISFLKKCFHKMMINFVWWVNKIDSAGNNIFEGGFLGLDNITVFDRSKGIPGGGKLEQSDGTGWMGFFCLKLMRIAIELSKHDSDYESLAVKFFEHFIYIAAALHKSGIRDVQIWDDLDGFFYDVICRPDGTHQKIGVRSLVGIIPIFAVDWIDQQELDDLKEFSVSINWFLTNRKDITKYCITSFDQDGKKGFLMSLMNVSQMKRVLKRAWDPDEFRSEYGLRSLSKYHDQNPIRLFDQVLQYEPGESRARVKGGNSNWRGPVWFPTTYLFIETLDRLYELLGEDFKVETPGGEPVDLKQMVDYFSRALLKLFQKREDGTRPIHGDNPIFKKDPSFSDQILFYEHFNGETGQGLGSSHQAGWTALIANIIHKWI
ncbi:MAG: glucosidase [Simkaniaceae bacterium]|nr:glucosidase [Simkaniaceae bacterium]MCF7852988.1 glucosidase [Simkaniaceae bacterium]